MGNVSMLPKFREFDARVRQRFSEGGGNGGGDVMWQQSVENRLTGLDLRIEGMRKDINGDFRWTWGGMVVGVLTLLGTMAAGFGWLP
jgi:hypothetical protein